LLDIRTSKCKNRIVHPILSSELANHGPQFPQLSQLIFLLGTIEHFQDSGQDFLDIRASLVQFFTPVEEFAQGVLIDIGVFKQQEVYWLAAFNHFLGQSAARVCDLLVKIL
jgi:hypothetical protein